MTTSSWRQTAGLLREAGGRLAGVQEELISPGLLHPVLALARRPEVWAGGLRHAFVGYFEQTDWFVRNQVAPRIESVVVWLQRRAHELEEYERAMAGATWLAEPGPPAPLGDPGPGRPGPFVPPSGPVVGFTGCDPAQVRQLASRVINAGAGAGALSARINTALNAVAGLAPPDALEASGTVGLFDLSVSLLDAARDLQRRAQTIEVGNFLCGLFGTGLGIPLPGGVDFVVAGTAAPPDAAPVAEGKADAERLCQAVADAKNGSCEGLETLAGDIAAKADDDPAYAADLVITLGPDDIDDLFDAPFRPSARGCAAPLLFTAGLIPQLLAAATWSDRLDDATLDVLLSPDNQHLAALLSPIVTLAPRAKDRIFDLVVEHPEHPAREQLLRVIGSDPDLAQRYAMVASLGVHETLFQTTEAWTALMAAMATTTDQERNYAEAALETAIRRVAQGQDMTDEARRGMALAISSRATDLSESLMRHPETELRDPGEPGPPDEEPLRREMEISQGELVKSMTELMKDKEARRTLELASGSLAAGYASAVADRYLDGLAAGNAAPDPEALKDLRRQGQRVGRFLCATVEAIGGRAKADADDAIEALVGMRVGIDVAFEAAKEGGKVALAAEGVPGPIAGKGAEWVAKQVRKPFDDYVGSLENERRAAARSATDAAHSMADRVVWDSVASGLLRQTLAAPPDRRGQLLDALGVQGVAEDGTPLVGVAALQHAGLLDTEGHFVLPPLGTAAYARYRRWASSDAEAFASRVDALAGPARDAFTDCVVHHLDVQDKGRK